MQKQLDADIFEPNKNGTYWFQTAINKKYMGKMKEEEFRAFIRKLLINNKTAPWNENEIYKEIISRSDKDYIEKNIDDLAESVKRKDISRIKILLALGTEADSNSAETNLLYCAKNGMTDIATILLNNYCNPNKTNNQNENAFWVAAFNENFNTALLLKKYGAKINTVNKNKETLMHIVYQKNMNNIFEFLLKEGASPNIKNCFGETVTFIAFNRKDDEIAEMLQDKYNGDINSQNNDMNTLAHLAFDRKDIQRIDYFKKRRIDMNLKNKKGHTVLMHAFFTGTNIENMEFLMNLGSNINTTDNDNNTMLHLLLFQNNPSQSVFSFLKNKKININIENNDGQYPISIAIAKGHDNIGFDLLNSNCKINNKTSVHEPIVEAIKRGSSKWVEALICHGANALNEKVGVASRYIKSSFFNFDIFKKIQQMNIFLEAPFQEAIYAKLNNCSLHIWNIAKSMDLCTKLAKNKDKHKRIPLSAAIMTKNDMLVKILLSSSYELESSDEDGRTPFIYACMVDCYPWMTDIFSKILLSNANKVDRNDCSALSYAAFNNNKSFCEELFIRNIEVDNIKTDKYGIIESFRTTLYKYEKIKKCSKQNYSDARSALDQLQKQKKQFKERLEEVEFQIKICVQDEYRIKHSDSVTEEDIKDFYWHFNNYKREKNFIEENLPKIKDEIDNARKNLEYYNNKYQLICEATRKDMLQKLPYLEKLSMRDKKIVTLDFKKDDSDCVIC